MLIAALRRQAEVGTVFRVESAHFLLDFRRDCLSFSHGVSLTLRCRRVLQMIIGSNTPRLNTISAGFDYVISTVSSRRACLMRRAAKMPLFFFRPRRALFHGAFPASSRRSAAAERCRRRRTFDMLRYARFRAVALICLHAVFQRAAAELFTMPPTLYFSIASSVAFFAEGARYAFIARRC